MCRWTNSRPPRRAASVGRRRGFGPPPPPGSSSKAAAPGSPGTRAGSAPRRDSPPGPSGLPAGGGPGAARVSAAAAAWPEEFAAGPLGGRGSLARGPPGLVPKAGAGASAVRPSGTAGPEAQQQPAEEEEPAVPAGAREVPGSWPPARETGSEEEGPESVLLAGGGAGGEAEPEKETKGRPVEEKRGPAPPPPCTSAGIARVTNPDYERIGNGMLWPVAPRGARVRPPHVSEGEGTGKPGEGTIKR